MRFSLIFSIFTIITCLSLAVHAQNTAIDTAYRLIEKNDGIKYIAKILSDDARELLIETETIGKIYIYKSEIKRISVINPEAKIVNGELFETGACELKLLSLVCDSRFVTGETLGEYFNEDVEILLTELVSAGYLYGCDEE